MGRPRAHAITSRSDFQKIFRQGRIIKATHLVAHIARGASADAGRMAVVVSRKHGGAVQRNRVRRRIREAVRRRGGPPPGLDAVFVARGGVEDLSFREIEREVDHIMEGMSKGAGESV